MSYEYDDNNILRDKHGNVISDVVCDEIVDAIIRTIGQTDKPGYNQYRCLDLTFERLIQVYKNFEMTPEDLIQHVYDQYEITIQ